MDKTYGLVVLLLLIARISADCHLGAREISQTNRVFAFRADDQLYPLRLNVMPAHQTLEMLCAARDVVFTTCQQNGGLKPPLPMSDCRNPPKGTVEVVADPSCPHVMHRVGYKLNDQQFLELYRSCYDANDQRAHFTIHVVYPNTLNGSRPEQGFTTDGVISSAAATSFQAKHIYQRFQELLGPRQAYVSFPRQVVFERGHLAPSADFGFEQYMRLTFKYINVMPQFRPINRSNWKIIENWIRKQLTNGIYPALQVCTGGLGVLQLRDSDRHLKAIYLGAQRNNPVPKWMFKIVNDGASTRHAFVIYNNVHDTVPPMPNCRQVACPMSLQLISNRKAGFSFCCDPNDFISRNAPNLETVC